MYLIINTAEHPFLYAGKSFMHNSLEFLILISKKHFFASLIYFGKKKKSNSWSELYDDGDEGVQDG